MTDERPEPDLVALARLEAETLDPVAAAWLRAEERLEHRLAVTPYLAFRVVGHPVTKAGVRMMPNGAVIGVGGDGLRSWQQEVAHAADAERRRLGWDTLRCPVGVSLEFRYAMPAYPTRPRWWHELGDVPRGTGDDLDKLVRAVLDGLTDSGVLDDDRRVARLYAAKDEVSGGWEGVDVAIRPITIERRSAA